MAMNFKKISQEKGLIESDLIAGRSAIPLAEIIGEELTLTAVVRTHWNKDGAEGDRPGMIFREIDNVWVKASGENIQNNIYAWAEQAGCPDDPDSEGCPFKNFDALNSELEEAGGLRVKFVRAKTSNGRDRNQLVILD